ncbi:MAG: type II restriction endonuclease [Candidatus Staskawiczbacteria bacterium]|nr:type II restriction endonuclease [Candidatus Staskawiczbacteria bacterium]
MDKNLNNIRELVRRGSSTARAGFRNEDDVVIKFNNWKEDDDAQDWLKIMDYDLDKIERVEAIKITGSHKTDVQVKIKIYLKAVIAAENISIKLVSNPTGFNQIDKRWVDKYAELWKMPENVVKSLKLFTGETKPKKKKLKDPRRMFFGEMDIQSQKDIVDFFESNKFLVIADILKGRDKLSASWMLIYIKPDNLWTLLPMSVIINFYGNGEVRITDKGSIKIGRITMQRKGGDGGRPTANMLQFKINPAEIVNETKNL